MATKNINTQVIAPELLVIAGKVLCTSLQIAHHFDKEHFIVLRDIDGQIEKIKAGRHAGKEAHMFQLGTYPVINNLGHKVNKPMYMLNRSGFIKLVNGYNGQKASDMQMDYIEAFDRMEEVLSLDGCHFHSGNMREPEQPAATITWKQWLELKSQVSMTTACLRHTGSSAEHHIFSALRILHNITDLQRMPASKYPAVLESAKTMLANARGEYTNFMYDIEQEYIQRHLCGGLPLTSTIKREWRKQHQTAFPQSPNWMQLANDLGMTPPPATH